MRTIVTLLCLAAAMAAEGNPTEQPTFYFLENKGQIKNEHGLLRTDIDYVINADGINIFIGAGQLYYQFSRMDHKTVSKKFDQQDTGRVTHLYRLGVSLMGADKNARVNAEDQHSFITRFYEMEQTAPAAKYNFEHGIEAFSYGKITYENIYPNIDWVLYVKNGRLEYDFVVKPGGNPADIRLEYSGADDLKINNDGSLSAATPLGVLLEQAPYSYQGDGTEVISHFKLDENILSFAVSPFQGTLTIDPVINWSTYYGSTNYDEYATIDLDSQGNIYVAGRTQSTSNLVTDNTTYTGGSYDGFISKFDTSGVLLWTTYWGTTSVDWIHDILSDGGNNVYLATRSSSLPSSFCKLSSNGVLLNAINTPNGTFIRSVEHDAAGNFYLGGGATLNGAATNNAYQTSLWGMNDCFVMKLDGGLNTVWATYYGGDGTEDLMDMAFDNSGYLLITGSTFSSTGIATVGQTMNMGLEDVFLAKIMTSNGYPAWGTYLGGSDNDGVFGVSIDTLSDAIFISGSTASTNGISTSGAYQPNPSSDGDSYLARFDPMGNLQWATYLGGNGTDGSTGCAVEMTGVYLTGMTSSTDLPSVNGWQQNNGGGVMDGYAAKFSKQGSLIWCSYFGGSEYDQLSCLAPDNAGALYIAGRTNSPSLSVNTTVQPNLTNTSADGIIAKVKDCPSLNPVNITAIDTSMCIGDIQTIAVSEVLNAGVYNWSLSTGISGSSIGDSILVTATAAGPATISVAAYGYCDTVQSQVINITVHPLPAPAIVNTGNLLSTGSYSGYQWNLNASPIPGANSQTHMAINGGSYTVTVTDSNGCTGTSGALPLSVTISETSGSLTIYPNPNEGDFIVSGHLSSISGEVSITLKDMSGKTVYNSKQIMKGSRIQLPLSVNDLISGVYILTLLTDTDHQIMRLIKK